jgi:hypothetical protein
MMAKGGEVNYLKKWRVKGINMQGKMFKKEITLGRMSDKNDVMYALKRMPDTNIREVTLIEEIKEDGGMMADGGELMKHKYNQNITIELIEPTNKGWKVKQIETHSVSGKKLSKPKEKVAYFTKDEIKDLFDVDVMAKGGTTKKSTFDQKVKSISKSLQGAKVKPKYVSKYGKTYDKAESVEAAKNIAGAIRAKYGE